MRWFMPGLLLCGMLVCARPHKALGSPIDDSLALVFDDGAGNTLPYR